jgi:hypothetical protein
MAALWLWCRLAFDWPAATAACLLFGLSRKWSQLGAEVLSDSLALCLMIWSLLAGVWAWQALERRRVRHGLLLAAACGLLGGLGYFVRPEAGAVPCVVGVMLLGAQLRRGRWGVAVLGLAIGAAALAALAIPYMLLIGDVSKKKRLLDLLNPVGLPATLPGGLGRFAQQVSEAMHPLPSVLLCVWLVALVAALCLRSKEAVSRLRPARPTGTWMLAVTLLWLALLLGLRRSAGYMSYRHVMFAAMVLLPLVGRGLIVLAEVLRDMLAKVRLPGPPAVALAGLLAMGLAVHSLAEPLHQEMPAFWKAARRLAALARPGDGILAEPRGLQFALGRTRPDWHVIPMDDERIKQWRLSGDSALGRADRPQVFLMSPYTILSMMDQVQASWLAVSVPRRTPQIRDWLRRMQEAGIPDLDAWAIPGTQQDIHVLGPAPARRAIATTPVSGFQPAPVR